MQEEARSVLIVDDDEHQRRALRRAFRAEAYQVDLASSGEEALNMMTDSPSDVALVDLYLEPNRPSGLVVVREMRRRWPRTAVLVITGRATTDLTACVMRAGAADVIEKPITVKSVGEALRKWKSSLHSLDVIRHVHVHAVVGANRGNKTRAAEQLRCSRQGLEKMLQRNAPLKGWGEIGD